MPTRIEDLLDLDSLLTPEDIELRQTVRRFGEQRLRPHIADWFEAGEVPVRELAADLGKLGVLGMHLKGYGCGGSTATAYGLVCQELEAVDSGLRSLVSVQGSLAMFAIYRWGSEEQRNQWLPAMATGDVIGCFGLTEPDFGSNPAGMRTTARRDRVGLDPERLEDVDHQRLGGGRGDRVGPLERGHHRLRRACGHARLFGAGHDAQTVVACVHHI
jgi:glutaryl-CoA dehydrogenase